MTNNNQQFQAAKVGYIFKKALSKFDKLLADINKKQFTNIRKKIRKELKEYREQGTIKVAFIGQYSAGKSTIISALTGIRNIKIDTDIGTEKTITYDWNSIKIIDTPGLFTERQEHDEITYEAINQADLLVFCLTYMLFDSVTIENFKKLAYDKGYRWKMMLVVNKMSDEAGEDEEKITNYRYSLTEALKPFNFDEFPVCFIDAKDYCEGIDENDNFLLEMSRFETFIAALNTFVERRSSLAKFDTPVRIVLKFVEDTQLILMSNFVENTTFFEVANRLSRTIRKERDRLRTKVKGISLDMSSAIIKEGNKLAMAVGTDADFVKLNKTAELNVRNFYEEAESKLQEVCETAVSDIREAVAEILDSDLVEAFICCLDKEQNISASNIDNGRNFPRLKSQVYWIKNIAEVAGVKIENSETKSFLTTTESSLGVGKFIGFKYKYWEAVSIAQNLGNDAKFLGPAVALVSVEMDVSEMRNESQRETEMSDLRREIYSQFQTIAKDLEAQINLQLSEFETQVYTEIERQIAEARKQEEEAIATSNNWIKQVGEIRSNFELIIQYIQKVTAKAKG
ncbi:GTPase [Okeania sp.]|uniref:GTPase n=1 Tax=Okeania sp. TaxID=3100323 RepID=UPI002B4AD34B|nr:GTPase [Okeania sp.]MEB3343342.1 GTPase [Okeania sp.]